MCGEPSTPHIVSLLRLVAKKPQLIDPCRIVEPPVQVTDLQAHIAELQTQLCKREEEKQDMRTSIETKQAAPVSKQRALTHRTVCYTRSPFSLASPEQSPGDQVERQESKKNTFRITGPSPPGPLPEIGDGEMGPISPLLGVPKV